MKTYDVQTDDYDEYVELLIHKQFEIVEEDMFLEDVESTLIHFNA